MACLAVCTDEDREAGECGTIPKSQKVPSRGAGDQDARGRRRGTSHTVFCEILKCSFKMLLILRKYYPKLQIWVAGSTLSCPPSFLLLQ